MKNYFEQFGRPPDFRIRYRWLGRDGLDHPQMLFQHMRTDFSYSEVIDEDEFGNYFVIHPEFELEKGTAIPDDDIVPPIGTAGMWIIIEEMRAYHRGRIKVGVKGFIVGGPVQIAEVEVIEVVSLSAN